MHSTSTEAGKTNGASASTEKPNEEKPKSRRGGGPRIPEGHKRIQFLIPDNEHVKLLQLADQDDRDEHSFARALVRRYLRDTPKSATVPPKQ